ncbi:hypothetical protein ACJW31_12G169900 [Castanea mollissima]
MLNHIESESHTCISPLFPAVIFEIVQQASLLMQESTWLSITNWKINSKVTLLPCIGKKHSTFIQNVYLRERKRNMACLLIIWSSNACLSKKKFIFFLILVQQNLKYGLEVNCTKVTIL